MRAQRVDELMDALDDVLVTANSLGQGMDSAEKARLRQESAANGKLHMLLTRIDAFVGEHGGDGFACGGVLTVADLYLFNVCSSAGSGFFDGLLPVHVLEPYANVQKVRRRVANLPAVRSWYDAQLEKPYMKTPMQGTTVGGIYQVFYDARDL